MEIQKKKKFENSKKSNELKGNWSKNKFNKITIFGHWALVIKKSLVLRIQISQPTDEASAATAVFAILNFKSM